MTQYVPTQYPGSAVATPPAPREVIAQAKPRKQKDQSIETLRFFAVMLVVAFHIRGDAPIAASSDVYEWLAYTFRSIRIPLFTVISGYLYSARPVVAGTYGDFVKGKLRRLLLPMACVASLEYLARALAPGADHAGQLKVMWQIYVLPYAHYWFLQAVFLALLVVGWLDTRRKLERFDHWLLAILAAHLALQLNPFNGKILEPLSVGAFLFLLPFFLLGLGIQRFSSQLMSTRSIASAVVVFLASLAVLQVNWNMGDTLIDSSKTGMWGLLLGISAAVLLFRFRPTVRPLAWIGGFSFSIYLFQAFGSGLGRRFLDIPGINPHVYFLSLLMFPLALGVMVELIAGRVPVLRTMLVGKS